LSAGKKEIITRKKLTNHEKINLFTCPYLPGGLHTFAQNTPFADGVRKNQLPIVYLPENVSVHFVSPEPIQYVDISAKNIIGDLPLKNVLRIRLRDSAKAADAVVTVAGETFITQYHVILADLITGRDVRTNIEIKPSDCRQLDIAG